MQCSFQGHLFMTDSFTVCETIHRAMIAIWAHRLIQELRRAYLGRTCTGARGQFWPDVVPAANDDSHWYSLSAFFTAYCSVVEGKVLT